MAIDLYSDSSSIGISPRISFSHDFPQTEGVPIEQYIRSASPSSSVDFDFCVFNESFDHESCSADEIFSDGKIRPVEIKRKLISAPKKKTEATPPPEMQKSKRTEVNCESEMQKSSSSKSFWGFKRSSSLNCGSGYARTLCPIPLLSRSNSTGSTSTAANGKKSTVVKENCPSRFKKSLSTSSSEKSPPAAGNHQKPPLKKSYGPYGGNGNGNGNGNGVKISPVINVPTPHMFGLGSIFSSSRDNKSKKK